MRGRSGRSPVFAKKDCGPPDNMHPARPGYGRAAWRVASGTDGRRADSGRGGDMAGGAGGGARPGQETVRGGALPRQVTEEYADAVVQLDPILGTFLGVPESAGLLPDFSPEGQEAEAELARTTLARLA